MLRPWLIPILSTLIATAASATSTTDLSVSVSRASNPVAAGRELSASFRVRNNGPDTARNVHLIVTPDATMTDSQIYAPGGICNGLDCAFALLGPGEETIDVNFYARASNTPGQVVTVAKVVTAENDPDLANNAVNLETDVVAWPDLDLAFEYPPAYLPEGKGRLNLSVSNFGVATATNVVLSVAFPDGAKVIGRSGGDMFDCDLTANPVICRAMALPVTTLHEPGVLHFDFLNPPLYGGGGVQATADVSAAEPDLFAADNHTFTSWSIYQFFGVTNTADSGLGSLRQAILDANATCGGKCGIGFRIPDPLPEAGFFTIRPQTPLPRVTFIGVIDGSAQAELLGSDAKAPLIMLDGSLLGGDGDGFVLTNYTQPIDLAIGNFPRFGILVDAPDFIPAGLPTLDRLYLGIDPRETPAPNLRGLCAIGSVEVKNCLISRNRASGIIAARGSAYIHDNRIVGNGASGVYVQTPAGATIRNNELAGNAHFGVGVDAPRHHVEITHNAIHDNSGGIDIGLDGPTGNVDDDSARFPNYPTIENIHYDEAAKRTSITFRIDTRVPPPVLEERYETNYWASVEIYANGSANGQAERFLASVDSARDFFKPFNEVTITVEGDLRGQWLTAITIRRRVDCHGGCATMFQASEISPPVLVP